MDNQSTICIMFEEIKQILKTIENNSVKSSENKKEDDSLSTSDLANQFRQSEELILSKLEQIGHSAQTAPKEVCHKISIDIKSSKVFLTILGLAVFVITSLFLCYKLKSENNKLNDNDIKYRFVKASNGIDSTKLNGLENIFVYNRNPKAIKELRERVLSYEKALMEEAQRLEQAKFKEQEAERLKQEAEDLKSKK